MTWASSLTRPRVGNVGRDDFFPEEMEGSRLRALRQFRAKFSRTGFLLRTGVSKRNVIPMGSTRCVTGAAETLNWEK